MPEDNQRDFQEIEYFLKKLRVITKQLGFVSNFLVLILLCSVVALAFFATSAKRDFYYSDFLLSYFVSILLPLFGIVILFLFSRQKKRGMLFYEEIIDEMEWSSKRSELRERTPIEYRVTIKEFIKSTDLPFTSGQSGQSFYFIFFLIMIVTTIVLGTVLRMK